ncbi:transglycosylase domain-containing protein [Campylobacter canadensis]|uniref:transglycosylase domain-containing protein n=1 Tax=Campylobacter canadensis TaxID=449520 RepID=UPI001CCB6E56|nr:PBP1A family penicillin-binding protein [Campylobacter canadensis]MBZ7995137.1 PBP1A family penicillin-binding protein [Campylobacter canadensis]MBZ8004377.1 PBP1A family penicillin-binding protein [Campylobacter canadensis]
MRVLIYFLSFCLLSLAVAFIALYSFVHSTDIDINNYKVKLSTQIYDRNGVLIANVFDENRLYAKFDEIPPKLIEALVAIEDTSFFEHGGINIDAIFRAIIKDIQKGRLAEGASTLTQQLVKNVYLTNEKSLQRKLKEAIISYEIEDNLSKEEILERYLNTIFLGHGYYGIKTAAQGYFHKNLDELNLKEMAILVGLPKAPSTYDPTKRLDLSLSRANAVIKRMYSLGWISKDEYEQNLNYKPVIYDESLSKNQAPYIVDEVIRQLKNAGIEDVKTGGYKIELSIDLNTQQLAQDALKFAWDAIVKRDANIDLNQINGAMVVTNPHTGEVLALVGGIDYEASKFNRATMSNRQLGSSFKPFVYLSALDLGYSPASKIADIARVFETVDAKGEKLIWKPSNITKNFSGLITLKEALSKSRNLATINLMLDCGLNVIHSSISDFGFHSVPKNLSIGLGSFGVSPYEYAELYSIISNYGLKQPIYLISHIYDKDGNEISIADKSPKEIVKAEQAFLMIDMLMDVVNNGSGRGAKLADIELAGKTGTSNKSIDAWFVGFSPEIQVVTWFGNDNNKPMKKYEGGARTAVPAFKYFMQNYIKLHPDTKRTFDIPDGVFKRQIDGKTWYYTNTSLLPKINNSDIILEQIEEEGLMF